MKISTIVVAAAAIISPAIANTVTVNTPGFETWCYTAPRDVINALSPRHIADVVREFCQENDGKHVGGGGNIRKNIEGYRLYDGSGPAKVTLRLDRTTIRDGRVSVDSCTRLFDNIVSLCPPAVNGNFENFKGGAAFFIKDFGGWSATLFT
ncbi:hypothetical protein FQN52_005284 [Onygenales sp. PD_12]|nr:hypothetical protein FQN53_009272 [Emmonsiellopsis sp. PD_33]KAK2795517.1 hypothetical protein FQN52_005284 [Onygenales sp. PD_12]KAK2799532.1 hypothetical protein FQN51_006846 [Onygenales sp. PD_10]